MTDQIVRECRKLAKIIVGIMVVPDGYRDGDGTEYPEPKTTLLAAAALIEGLSAEKAGDVRAELEKAEWVLRSSGFRRCDIPACNCNSWHHVGGYAERFREIKEAVEEAGYSTNGKVLLDVIADIIALAAESTVARLTGEKNDPVGQRKDGDQRSPGESA
jgi:hypothetical protein